MLIWPRDACHDRQRTSDDVSSTEDTCWLRIMFGSMFCSHGDPYEDTRHKAAACILFCCSMLDCRRQTLWLLVSAAQ